MVSFPFFAVDREELRIATVERLQMELEGPYGFKRFSVSSRCSDLKFL